MSSTLSNTVRSTTGTSNTIAAGVNQSLTLNGSFDAGVDTTTTFGSPTNSGIINFAPTTNVSDPSNQIVIAGGTLLAGNDQLRRTTATALSTTVAGPGVLDLGSYDTTIRNLQGSGTVGTGSAATLALGGGTFTGSIGGGAGLTLLGDGTGSNSTVLSGTNTYLGDTIINSGSSLTVQGGSALPTTSAVTNNGTFLVASSQAVGSLAGTGATGIASGAVLSAGVNNRDTTYAGAITGDGGLLKTGTGTMILSGNSTYVGPTMVGVGTLQVDGSIASGVAVQTGATIGGSGQIAGNVTIADGGVLAPAGASVGTLTMGSLALSSGSIINYGLGQGGTVGSGVNDLVQINGNLTLAGTLNLTDVGGFGEGVYRLMNYAGSLTNNGVAFGSIPSTVTTDALTVQTAVGGQVNLVVNGSGNLHFWDGTHDTADNSVSGGTRTWSTSPSNWTSANGGLNAPWRGGFAVFQAQAGTVTVDGAIEATGMQFLTDGYRITNTAGSTLVNNTAQTTIRVDAGVRAEIAAPLTGSAALVKRDAGTLLLSGNNTYTGGTAVTGGVLSVSQDANLGQASSVLVLDGGTLQATGSFSSNRATTLGPSNGAIAVDGGQALTLTGVVAGSGSLTKLSGGTLILAGVNTFTGTTTVTEGTLSLVAGASLASSVANDATFINGGTVLGSLTNTGTFENTGTLAGGLTNTGTATISAGQMNGAIANNSGTFTAQGAVSSDSSFANAAGAMLSVGSTGAYAVGGVLTNSGTVVVADGGTLTAPSGIYNSGVITIAQGGTVVDALANSGAVSNSGTYIADVTNAAPGSITNQVTGSWIGNLLGNLGKILNIGGWTGDASNSVGGEVTNTGSWRTTSAPLANAGTFTNAAGAVLRGGLVTSGTATNDGTINGSVTVTSGVMTTTGAIVGDLTNAATTTASGSLNGSVVNNTGANFIVAGSLTDIGAFTNNGSLELGANALTIGSLAGTNSTAVVRNGSLNTGSNNASTAYSGVIADGSAATMLTKSGSGTFTLRGSNTYSGGTVLNGGRISVAADNSLGALSSDLTFTGGALETTANITSARNASLTAAGGTLITDAGTTLTLSGRVSGAGQLAKEGAGTLALTGTNTYSGGTLISGGAVIGSVESFGSGSITNNAALIVDQATAASFSNAINGSGTLVKIGTGSLTYTGTGTLSGPTLAAGGLLAINGSLANSAITVASGAALGGTGTIGGLIVQSGAAVAPGNSIGQLNVAGNVSFSAGSVFQVEANASGQGDLITASGTATLAGGTVQVLATPGAYQPRTRYTILTASGGVNGQFAGVTSNLAFLTPFLGYDAKDAYLTLARNDLDFSAVAHTRNQGNVASAVQAGAVGNPLYDAVAVLSAPQARTAFNALSGEIHVSAATAQFETAFFVREAILDRLRSGNDGTFSGCSGSIGQDPRAKLGVGGSSLEQSCLPGGTVPATYTADLPGRAPQIVEVSTRIIDPRVFAVWGQGFGAFGSTASDGNAARLERQTSGFVLGADARLEGEWRLGMAGGYSFTNLDITGRLSSGTVESGYGAIYGGGLLGPVQIRLGAVYGGNSLTTQRAVTFAGFSETTTARYNGTTAQGFGEIGYRIGLGAASIEPFVGGAVIRIEHDRFTERGGAGALTMLRHDYDLATSTIGLRGEMGLGSVFNTDLPILARGLIGYRRAYGDVVPSALLSFGATGQSFLTAGVPIDRDALVAQAGLDWQITTATTLGLSYTGQVGSRAQDHGLKGNFTYRF